MHGVKTTEKKRLPATPETALLPDALQMLQALPEAVMAVNAQEQVVFANHAALAFLGMGEKTLAAQMLPQLFGVAHPVIQALHLSMQGGQSLTLHDLEIVKKNVLSLSIIPMQSPDDLYLLSWRFDRLPVRNEWLSKLRASFKPAQMLAQMLAHEVRNPLAGIRGAAQLLGKSVTSDDDRALATLIEQETQRIMRLVDKVNVFDNTPRQEFKRINIHAVTDYVLQLAANGCAAQVELHSQYDPSLPDIDGHADGLTQAILNIIKNAAEAGATNITIRSFFDTTAAVHPETGARLPIVLDIQDNGQGMDAETAARLFEPCYTTKPQGDGLGLVIVSRIIDEHGGTIDVASAPGKTHFRLSLPMPRPLQEAR